MIFEVAEHAQKKNRRTGTPGGEKRMRYRSNMVNLCVDVCDGGVLQGKLYHLYTREPVPFLSLFQAMKRMNELYDDLRFPTSSTVPRSFSAGQRLRKQAVGRTEPAGRGKERKEEETLDRMLGRRGKRGTFLIRVQYRQHSSWQGEVTWVEGGKKEYFRSALELAGLLGSALELAGLLGSALAI